MKKFVSIVLIFVLVLSLGVMFASCKKNDDVSSNEPVVESYVTTTTDNKAVEEDEAETVYVVVTDENGQEVTDNDKNDAQKTEADKEIDKNEETTAYSVMGGSDPYVYDIF